MPIPTLLDNLQPSDIGLPDHFNQFRDIQREMAEFCLFGPNGVGTTSAPRRFSACGAPPGSGKSVAAHAIGILSGKKYVILTPTRQLQDQYKDDGFNAIDVRGKDNYTCRDSHAAGRVGFGGDLCRPPEGDEWSCLDGAEDKDCTFAGKPGCTYFDQVEAARQSRGTVTNPMYWMSARAQNRVALEAKGEPIGLLIVDELQKVFGEVARFLGTWVSNENLHRWANKEVRALVNVTKGAEWGRVTGAWVDALEMVVLGVKVEQSRIAEKYPNVAWVARQDADWRKWEKIAQGLDKVCSHGRDNNWLWRQTKNGIAFDCIWPGRYAERYLWSGVGQIILMSGTLRPKAMHMLNVKSTDYHFKEWPRQFPAHLSPVWWVPTGRMGRKSSEDERYKQVELLAKIGEEWGHKKGLIHTPSYKLAEWLQSMSPWGRHMLINERGEAGTMLERFKKSKPPSILVSPSYTTGADLPDSDCEWIWVPKLPYPDRSDPVVLARCEDDPDYYVYETAQTLEQECLRGSRHDKDRCTCVHPETLILTDDLRWVEAHTLKPTDRLLGFDEHGSGRADPRRWRWSNVIEAKTRTMSRVRVIYGTGEEVICTPNHKWLTLGKSDRCIHWTATNRLKVGSMLFRLSKVWKSAQTYNEGWLGGFFDGEGCLCLRASSRNPNVVTLVASQRIGPTLEYACRQIASCGFSYSIQKATSDGRNIMNYGGIPHQGRIIRIGGGQPEIMRFLGQNRPIRLLDKFLKGERAERISAIDYPKVIHIERLAPGPITSLQTSTETFIANGLGAHNTIISDDSVGNFRNYARRHFSGWFRIDKWEKGGIPTCK